MRANSVLSKFEILSDVAEMAACIVEDALNIGIRGN